MTADQYKALRESVGTQAHAAGILGVHRVTIAKRESGRMRLTWEACLAMGAIAPLRSPKRKLKSGNAERIHGGAEDPNPNKTLPAVG